MYEKGGHADSVEDWLPPKEAMKESGLTQVLTHRDGWAQDGCRRPQGSNLLTASPNASRR